MDSSIDLAPFKSESIKKKPTLIINKNCLFKADSVIFVKTPTKRSLTQETTVQLYDGNAKNICYEHNVEQHIAVSIINKTGKTSSVKYLNTQPKKITNEPGNLNDPFNDQENVVPFKIINKVESEAITRDLVPTPSKNKERPMKRCEKHEHLPEYQAEGLVQVNDEFASIEEFINYTYAHAKQWCFYYKIGGSNQPKLEVGKRNQAKYTPTIYGFDCIFLKKRESQSKGIRKVSVFRETSCEARVVLKRRYGEDVFKVTHACHHHDHKLTPEEFLKVPNAHRLSPAMKKEIDELLAFNLEMPLLKQYVLTETGMDLRKNVCNRYQAVKKRERDKIMKAMTPERMKIILEKIKNIRANFAKPKRKTTIKDGLKRKLKPKKEKCHVLAKYDEVEDTDNQDDDLFEQEVVQSQPSSPAIKHQSRQYSSDEELTPNDAEQRKTFRGKCGRGGVRLNKLATLTLATRSKPKQLSRRKISQEVSNEIRDLAWFGLDAEIIRRHFYFETGKDLIKYIKYTIDEIVHRATEPLEIRQDKLDEVIEKIRHLEDKYGPIENNNWLSHKRKLDKERKALKSMKNTMDSPSRVETRLKNIMSDQQLIDSVEELKRTTGCDIQIQEVDDRSLELEVVNEIEIEYVSNDHNAGAVYVNKDHSADEDYNDSNEHCAGDEYIINEHRVDEEYISNVHDADEEYISNEQSAGEEYIINIKHDAGEEHISNEHDVKEEYISNVHNVGKEYIGNENDAGEGHLSFEHYDSEEYICNENNAGDEYITNEHSANGKYISNKNDDDKQYVDNVTDMTPTTNIDNKLRDMAVQADFELLVLDSNYESIQKMELAAISEDLSNSKYTSNTRGQPNVIEEEAIVNKFNLELYISNFTGVTTCLEDIAADMNISVLELIKKIYKGEGVFKMTMGRSGQQNRITVQLTYVPLTITFPYEKFKYINSLQEYKAMCSKYMDLAMNLEEVVDNLSTELKERKMLESQSEQFALLQKEKEKNYTQSKQIAQLQKALQESNAQLEKIERKKMKKEKFKNELMSVGPRIFIKKKGSVS